MPRIRSIKPEHWSDKNLPKISLGAHLLWISMWNFSDDRGVIECDYNLIKSNSFPRRKEIKPSNIKKWIIELIKQDYVIPFNYDGIQYLIHRTFDVHQKIDKPQKSKISEDAIRKAFAERSTNKVRMVNEVSDNIRRKDRIGEDMDSKGTDSGVFKDQIFIVPEMQKIWKKEKPEYPDDITKDSTALRLISDFICEQSGIKVPIKNKEDTESVLKLWQVVASFVSTHNFFKNYSLHQVEKHIQSITQAFKNGESDSKNGKSVAGKVNGKQLNEAFTKFYSVAKSG